LDQARHLDPDAFCRLIQMEDRAELSTAQARTVLKELLAASGSGRGATDPAAIAARLGFEAMADDALGAAVDEVIAANPEEWARYCEGEDKLAGLFIGQVKRATQGKADPAAVSALLRARRPSPG
jgi:aspartyl-tRNA(Asn)/glutamyl-tRNA(Gln) amidotransferase subunit B